MVGSLVSASPTTTHWLKIMCEATHTHPKCVRKVTTTCENSLWVESPTGYWDVCDFNSHTQINMSWTVWAHTVCELTQCEPTVCGLTQYELTHPCATQVNHPSPSILLCISIFPIDPTWDAGGGLRVGQTEGRAGRAPGLWKVAMRNMSPAPGWVYPKMG